MGEQEMKKVTAGRDALGATADGFFSHLAIEVPGENTHTEWCEPVTDAAYAALK